MGFIYSVAEVTKKPESTNAMKNAGNESPTDLVSIVLLIEVIEIYYILPLLDEWNDIENFVFMTFLSNTRFHR